MTKITSKNWREKFDKLGFNCLYVKIFKNEFGLKPISSRVKFFISQVLQAQAKDLAGKKEKLNQNCEHDYGKVVKIQSRNQHRQEVLEKGKLWVK